MVVKDNPKSVPLCVVAGIIVTGYFTYQRVPISEKISSLTVWRSWFREEEYEDSDEHTHVCDVPVTMKGKRDEIRRARKNNAINEIRKPSRKNPKQSAPLMRKFPKRKTDSGKHERVSNSKNEEWYRQTERPGSVFEVRNPERSKRKP
jgi:hypothetical protein